MLFKKSREEKVREMAACVSGRVIPLKEVKDPVFAEGSMGEGIGIEPKSNVVMAPCAGVVTVAMEDTRHAIGLKLNNGAEILIHVGIDTVEMGGEGFELFVKENENVHAGDKLIQFDADFIHSKGLEATCIVLLTNADEYPHAEYISGMNAEAGKTIIMKFNEK